MGWGYEEYEIIDLHFFVEDEQACLELALEQGSDRRRLRFVGCQDVSFRPGAGGRFGWFPCLFDVSGHGVEGLNVLVADEDGTAATCQLFLWARRMEACR